MYTCERCGTRFAPRSAAIGSCPRCLARDGVRVPLSFHLFERPSLGRIDPRPRNGLEVAVRRGLSSGAR